MLGLVSELERIEKAKVKAEEKIKKDYERDYENIRPLIDYDPESGSLKWSEKARSNLAGKDMGYKRSDKGKKRVVLQINGTKYPASHVIYYHMTGNWPKKVVFVDDNPLNLKWSNIKRLCKGVKQLPSGRWAARAHGKYIGTFETEEIARAEKEKAEGH